MSFHTGEGLLPACVHTTGSLRGAHVCHLLSTVFTGVNASKVAGVTSAPDLSIPPVPGGGYKRDMV